jgi:hypothetical protein
MLPCFGISAKAGILVNLDATSLPLGPLPTWANTGTVAGDFTASGTPAVATVGGVKAVTLAGGVDFYTGPTAPSQVAGVNPSRSIEVWAFNPSVAGEETLVAWGRRGGPDGTNLAFNYGADASFGAVGQWGGGPDLGWNNAGGSPTPGVWHYLVYTYDGGGAEGEGTTRVYANGQLQNSEFHGNLNTHDGLPFVLGGQNNEAGTPAGFNQGLSLARVRIHDTVLTPEQIAAQFAAELPQIYPSAFLAGSRISSTSEFAFRIEDRPPNSVTNPSTFTVSVDGIRPGWQVPGGEGVINGSITSPAVVIPSAGPVELTVRHRYNFEGDFTPANAYDGGVIQFSINGGDFTTLENDNFSANGYFDSPIIGTGPLNGSLAFNGPSPGFAAGTLINSVATIPGVNAGDSVRVRFFGAWDEGFTPDGIDWDIAGLTLKVGATVVADQDFSGGDGGFTGESTGGGATWSFVAGNQPTLGALRVNKTGNITTLDQPIDWVGGRSYAFTIRGKDTNGTDLVFTTIVNTPGLVLAPARVWPSTIPGPLGTAGAWGVRTYLNQGINNAETIEAALEFLANANDRTPQATPDTVIDTQEPNLNFVDPSSNGPGGVIGCPRPFPADALSTATNGGTARNDDYVVTSAHGTIQVAEQGDYTFNFRGDDGFMFRIKAENGPHPKFVAVGGLGSVDAEQQNVIYYPVGTGDVNTRGVIHLLAGVYHLEYMTWEGNGGFWYQVSSAKGFYPNNEDTTDWRAVGYTTTRTTPIPYPSMAGDWTVLSTEPNGVTLMTVAGADAGVDAAVAADAAAATSLWPMINFRDPESGGTGRVAGDVPWPRNTPADDNKYGMRMSGTLVIPEAGDYLIGFQGDDGSRLTIGGVHGGFSQLVENVTGAGLIGRSNTPALNSGSAGAAAHSDPDTSLIFEQPGALAGSTDKAAKATTVGGTKVTVPFLASLNPITGEGDVAPFTVEVWAKPVNLTSGAQAAVNSMIAGTNQNPANANDRSGYLLRLNNADWQFYLGYTEGAPFYTIATGAGSAEEGAWQHVVGVWNGTTQALYVNGTKVAEETPPVPPKANFAAPLLLGKRGFGDWLFNGDLDEVAVYNTVLSEATIAAHYQNGMDANRTTPYEALVQASAPVGYWRLNETTQPRADTGTITTDVATGDSSTVGRINLAAGEYPISATFWEDLGGSYFEIFATRDIPGGCVPVQGLRTGGWPSIPDSSGLPLVSAVPPPAPVLAGGLTINTDGSLSLTIQSTPGASYTLQESINLASWSEVETVVATAATTTFTGTAGESFYYNPNQPNTFYRVRANR